MKPKLFRKQDYHSALREHASIMDCNKAIEDRVLSGDLNEAVMFVRDNNKSLEALKSMAVKKRLYVKGKSLLDELVTAGVNVMW